jgi:hypothetical protein
MEGYFHRMELGETLSKKWIISFNIPIRVIGLARAAIRCWVGH